MSKMMADESFSKFSLEKFIVMHLGEAFSKKHICLSQFSASVCVPTSSSFALCRVRSKSIRVEILQLRTKNQKRS